eukprot:3680833-Amphidinium_carterae.1
MSFQWVLDIQFDCHNASVPAHNIQWLSRCQYVGPGSGYKPPELSALMRKVRKLKMVPDRTAQPNRKRTHAMITAF